MISVEPRSTLVRCARPEIGSSFSKGGGRGCDLWEREPGIDDDDWDPFGVPQLAPYRPAAPPAPRARSRGTDGWWAEPVGPRGPAKAVPVATAPSPTRDPFGGIFNWDDA